jgi:hypothetical protein
MGKNTQLQTQTVSSSEWKTNKIAKKVLQNVLQNTEFTNTIFTFNTLSQYVYKCNFFFTTIRKLAFPALIFTKPTNAQYWGREGHAFLGNLIYIYENNTILSTISSSIPQLVEMWQHFKRTFRCATPTVFLHTARYELKVSHNKTRFFCSFIQADDMFRPLF